MGLEHMHFHFHLTTFNGNGNSDTIMYLHCLRIDPSNTIQCSDLILTQINQISSLNWVNKVKE